MLFVDMGLSQTEIANRLKKNKSQINRWAKAGNWDTLRASMMATTKRIVQRTFAQINKVYDQIEEEDRAINTTESDQVAKLMASIRTIDRAADLATYMQALEEFTIHIREQDPEIAAEIGDFQMEFLTAKAVQLSKD